MLKMDGCNVDVKLMNTGYPNMTLALNKTGRPIVFSCSWPDYERIAKIPVNYTRVAKYCNLWRNFDDIGVGVRGVARNTLNRVIILTQFPNVLLLYIQLRTVGIVWRV